VKCWAKVAALLLFVAAIHGGAQSAPEGQGGADTQARGVWTDPSTGLMWAGKDNGKDVNFKSAVKYCRNLHLAGYSDWRLANMFELQPLYDKAVDSPGLTRRDDSVKTMWHVKGNLFLTGYPWANDQNKSTSGYHYYFDFNEGKSNDQPTGSPTRAPSCERCVCAVQVIRWAVSGSILSAFMGCPLAFVPLREKKHGALHRE
jgi:hypothetical protein